VPQVSLPKPCYRTVFTVGQQNAPSIVDGAFLHDGSADHSAQLTTSVQFSPSNDRTHCGLATLR